MRRKWIVATAVVLVVVAGVIAWWVAASAPTVAAPDPVPAQLSTEDGQRAAAALEALESAPESLLPAELVGTVDLRDAVPPGTDVEADPATWTASEAGGGVIQMTLTHPDGSRSTAAAVMVEDAGEWKVLQTIPLESTQ